MVGVSFIVFMHKVQGKVWSELHSKHNLCLTVWCWLVKWSWLSQGESWSKTRFRMNYAMPWNLKSQRLYIIVAARLTGEQGDHNSILHAALQRTQCRKQNLWLKWMRLVVMKRIQQACSVVLAFSSNQWKEGNRNAYIESLVQGAEDYSESRGLKNKKTGMDKPSVCPLQSPEAEPPVILLGMAVKWMASIWPSLISFTMPLQKQNPESFSSLFTSGARYVEVLLNPCEPKNVEIVVDKLNVFPPEAEPVILFSFIRSFQVRQIREIESHGSTHLSWCADLHKTRRKDTGNLRRG